MCAFHGLHHLRDEFDQEGQLEAHWPPLYQCPHILPDHRATEYTLDSAQIRCLAADRRLVATYVLLRKSLKIRSCFHLITKKHTADDTYLSRNDESVANASSMISLLWV